MCNIANEINCVQQTYPIHPDYYAECRIIIEDDLFSLSDMNYYYEQFNWIFIIFHLRYVFHNNFQHNEFSSFHFELIDFIVFSLLLLFIVCAFSYANIWWFYILFFCIVIYFIKMKLCYVKSSLHQFWIDHNLYP